MAYERVFHIHHDLMIKSIVTDTNWSDWNRLDQKAATISMHAKMAVYDSPIVKRPLDSSRLVSGDSQRFEDTCSIENVNRFFLYKVW